MQGGIIDKDMPIAGRNVAIVCPNDGKPTRVGYQLRRRRHARSASAASAGGEL